MKVLEKKFFFEKKFFQLICADMIFKTVYEFFLHKWVARYSSFGDLRFRKVVLHNEINKTRSTKNQENSAIFSQIISPNFCKIGLNPKS